MLAGIAAAARASGDTVVETAQFMGKSDWLVLYGVGAPVNDQARKAQIARGGRVLIWDLGYVDRKKLVGHLRMSIDTDHPDRWLDKTPADPQRWDSLGVELREDARPGGPIILVGLGPKAKRYLGLFDWEARKLKDLKRRFPGRKIIHRSKPGKPVVSIGCPVDSTTPIEQLLHGASLVVCRHSNVAVDAAIAGVPFECEHGAAHWLMGKPYTLEVRLDFLRRCAHWQWKASESTEAWKFLTRITDAT